MGSTSLDGDAGLIPRICNEILLICSSQCNSEKSFVFNVSFVEIYNEKVFDLLSSSPGAPCRVREHPETGAYVENLTKVAVKSYSDVETVLAEGNSKRRVAATLMNSESSRSHAVLYGNLSISFKEGDTNVIRSSKIQMIDLAGSERVNTSGVSADRLREASNINRSLSVLADVINALSRISENRRQQGCKGDSFVPYRNSQLTWLLKDCLGGNSRTTMLATVRPADDCVNESISTLRYLERVKLIAIKCQINEKRNAKEHVLADLIRSNEFLKDQLVLLSANQRRVVCGCARMSDSVSLIVEGDRSCQVFLRNFLFSYLDIFLVAWTRKVLLSRSVVCEIALNWFLL